MYIYIYTLRSNMSNVTGLYGYRFIKCPFFLNNLEQTILQCILVIVHLFPFSILRNLGPKYPCLLKPDWMKCPWGHQIISIICYHNVTETRFKEDMSFDVIIIFRWVLYSWGKVWTGWILKTNCLVCIQLKISYLVYICLIVFVLFLTILVK